MKSATSVLFALALTVTSVFSTQASLLIYSNDFDGTEVFGSGVSGGMSGITTTAAAGGLTGMSGSFLHNTSLSSLTTLSLSGLPSHTMLDVGFIFAFIDSWDSVDGSVAPDLFDVFIDGILALSITCNNTSGTSCYAGTSLSGAGANLFGSGFFDITFDMNPEASLYVAHSASTVTIDFFASGAGWQGGADESWGMDNLNVYIDPTTAPPPPTSAPEPASLLLLLLAMLPGVKRISGKR